MSLKQRLTKLEGCYGHRRRFLMFQAPVDASEQQLEQLKKEAKEKAGIKDSDDTFTIILRQFSGLAKTTDS